MRRELEEIADRRVSLGAIYATLDRLENKGLVTSIPGPSGRERRGRAKRFFQVERSGLQALRTTLGSLDRMREGIELLEKRVGAET